MVEQVGQGTQTSEVKEAAPAPAASGDDFQKIVNQKKAAASGGAVSDPAPAKEAPGGSNETGAGPTGGASESTGDAQHSASGGNGGKDSAASGNAGIDAGGANDLRGGGAGSGDAPDSASGGNGGKDSAASGNDGIDAGASDLRSGGSGSVASGDASAPSASGGIPGINTLTAITPKSDPDFITGEIGKLYASGDAHTPGAKDIKVVTKDDPFVDIDDVNYISTPDALGAGVMYSVVREGKGPDQVRLVYNTDAPGIAATPGHYDNLLGLRMVNPGLFDKGIVERQTGSAIGDAPGASGGTPEPRGGKPEASGDGSPKEPEKAKPNYGPPGPEWKRPVGDNRDAATIISQNKALQTLQPNLEEWLKNGFGGDTPFNGIGDYEMDADAAYRAAKVIEHIQKYDVNGGRIYGESTDDGHLDGFFQEKGKGPYVANPDTEAARFQDFTKYGWDYLKGGEKPPAPAGQPAPDRTTEQVLKMNPILANLGDREKQQLKERVGDYEKDAEAAKKAVTVLGRIERYDNEGKPLRGDSTIGNGMLDGFDKSVNGNADAGTEAARFQRYIREGETGLKQATPAQSVDMTQLEDWAGRLSDTIPDEDYDQFKSFIDELEDGAHYYLIQKADLPQTKKDIIEHPESYSTEQRGAAVLELNMMLTRIQNGAGNWNEDGVAHGNRYLRSGNTFHSDVNNVISELNDAIKRLDSGDVRRWRDEAVPTTLQSIVESSPRLKQFAEGKVDDFKNKADWLDQEIGEGDDILRGMTNYLAKISLLNDAAGKNGKPYIDNLTLNAEKSPAYDKIKDAYGKQFGDSYTLANLVLGDRLGDLKERLTDENVKKMSEDDKEEVARKFKEIVDGIDREELKNREAAAIQELTTRGTLFSQFGFPLEGITPIVNVNTQKYAMGKANQDDLKGIVLKDDGSIDEDKLKEIIQGIKKETPGSNLLRDDDGQELTEAQIVSGLRNGWDTMRQAGKNDNTQRQYNTKRIHGFLGDDSNLRGSFSVGILHTLSAIMAGGALIAKGADGVSSNEIPSLVGSAAQVVGLGGEGYYRSFRDPKTGKPDPTKFRNDKALQGMTKQEAQKHLKNILDPKTDRFRLITATGGFLVLGSSIAMGVEALRSGDKTGAALMFATGVSNAAASPFAFLQAVSRQVPAMASWYRPLALAAGWASMATNFLTAGLALGIGLYYRIQEEKNQHNFFARIGPTLGDYGVDGGGEHDPWYDEHSALIGS